VRRADLGRIRRCLVDHADREQSGCFANAALQPSLWIEPAPAEDLVGVYSVRSRHECDRRPRPKCFLDGLPLIFQRKSGDFNGTVA
jgi:hypothetical protein